MNHYLFLPPKQKQNRFGSNHNWSSTQVLVRLWKKSAINGPLGGQITCYMYKQRDVILHAMRVFYFVSAIVWKERGRKLFLEIKVDGQLFGVQSPLLWALKVLFKTKSTKDFKNLNLHIRMRGLCLFPPTWYNAAVLS